MNSLPAGRVVDARVPLPQAPADSLTLQNAVTAALELELLQHWDDSANRTSGAAAYQLAGYAATTGDRAATLQHLEQAILAHLAYAQTAQQDPAFAAVKSDLRDMMGRLTAVTRIRAEAAIAAAGEAIESSRSSDAANLGRAQAFLNLAQAHFESPSYPGFVIAAQAAAISQQCVEQSNAVSRASQSPGPAKILLRPLSASVRNTARRLWQSLPLLSILLAWLLTGILAGILSLPFHHGIVAELRQSLFPIWAMGLLSMVLLGFIRSIRRISRR